MTGLRERKKQRTRRALVNAALRSFKEKGYEETTIAEIAAEADVSARTFFSYFASKEDVIFHDGPERMRRARELVAGRRPGEPVADLLLRVTRASLEAAAGPEEFDLEEATARLELMLTVPALQARGLHLLFEQQLQLAEALERAYPGELDTVEAAAVVGSLIGAIKLAAMVSLTRGDPRERMREAVRTAAEIALHGLPARFTGADRAPAEP
ncbi:TetR/AcrR family transcriptional regulator [Nonomuraea sp. CA-218870]|uniref:TetR/AcrR family transcriptional regulator n=1 Tax=Nonomuraea sp. CA-218870 TaxID=3239998 RepID=UPI003D8AFB0F